MGKYILFKYNEMGDGIEKIHQSGLSLIEALKLATENHLSYCDEDIVEGLEFKYFSYRKNNKIC
jgi:hypothetical protein